MSKDIKKAVEYMKKIAKDNTHGYAQDNRYGNPDYDCSSLVTFALREAGFDIDKKSYTGNLYKQLVKNGFKKCSKPFKSGDIHLCEGHHVCMSVSPTKIVEANINEKGSTKNGKKGDQTGKEIWERNYYEYRKGWDYHLRYVGKSEKSESVTADFQKLVTDTINGKYGHGEERRKKLTKLGYDWKKVQNAINKKLGSSKRY